MGFMEYLNQAKAGLLNEISKYRNAEFLEAMVAGCVWMAYADTKVDSVEKTKMLGFVQHSEELKVFDISTVLAAWRKFDEIFTFDVNAGISAAQNALRKIEDVGQKNTIVLGCCSIGSSDGNFDELEQEVARKICSIFQLNTKDFNL